MHVTSNGAFHPGIGRRELSEGSLGPWGALFPFELSKFSVPVRDDGAASCLRNKSDRIPCRKSAGSLSRPIQEMRPFWLNPPDLPLDMLPPLVARRISGREPSILISFMAPGCFGASSIKTPRYRRSACHWSIAHLLSAGNGGRSFERSSKIFRKWLIPWLAVARLQLGSVRALACRRWRLPIAKFWRKVSCGGVFWFWCLSLWEFLCWIIGLRVERMRSRQKWRQKECGRAPVCEGKLMRRPPWRARARPANHARWQ